MARKLRLAIVQSHPIQYFSPLFREIASRPDLELKVFYCSRAGLDLFVDSGFGAKYSWSTPVLGGYESEFVPNRVAAPFSGSMLSLINPGIVGRLRAGKFDAVMIHGYNYLTYWLVFAYCAIGGIPMLLRGESNLLHPRNWHVRVLKELILRPLLKLFSGCFYIGQANKEYFKHYGMPEASLFHAPYSVDNDYFKTQASELRPHNFECKQRFGLDNRGPVILFAGKLVEKKQPLQLLRAFTRVRAVEPCALLFAGDGPLRSIIEEEIRRNVIPDVKISGFLNQSELPRAYAAADIFVLPSKIEPWGLVINEAMSSALPVITTDRVGCARDLVRDSFNGFIIPWNDEERLSSVIARLVENPLLREEMGRRSSEMIDGWSVSRSADGILLGLRAAVGA